MNEPQPPNNRIPPESKPEKRKSLWQDEPEVVSPSALNADIEALRARNRRCYLVYETDCTPEWKTNAD